MVFLNRYAERQVIADFLNSGAPSTIRTLQIDGKEGVGKTDLLRYVAFSEENRAFQFEDDLRFHKCRKGDQDSDFSMLTPMIGALALRHPRTFAKTTTETARKLSIPPISQIVLHVAAGLPYLKSVAASYGPELSELAASKIQLLNLARGSHAVRALSKFIVTCVREEHPQNGVLFLIDDIDWIDLPSYRTLLSVTRQLSREGFKVFLIFTSNASKDEQADNLVEVEAALRDYPEIFADFLQIDNLTPEQLAEVVENSGRNLSVQEKSYLFEITTGNFSDLMRILRQREDKIRIMYRNWCATADRGSTLSGNDIWRERLKALFSHAPCIRTAFAILATLENVATVDEMRHLMGALSRDHDWSPMSRSELIAALAVGLEAGDLQVVGNYVIADRHLLNVAISVFLTDGSYATNYRKIAKIYLEGSLQHAIDPLEATARGIAILNVVDPIESFTFLEETLSEVQRHQTVPAGLTVAAVETLRGIKGQIASDRLVEAGARLVELAVRSSNFRAAAEAGDAIYSSNAQLADDQRLRFNLNYLVALREDGRLDRPDSVSGRKIAQELIESAITPAQKAEALLTSATVYEHLQDYEAIAGCFAQLPSVISAIEVSNDKLRAEIGYARNLGLFKYHGDIIPDIEKILGKVPRNDDFVVQNARDRASLMNQIGLGYYHRGEIKKAESSFASSLDELERIDRRVETPLNNLGACQLYLGDLEGAFGRLEGARDLPIKPRYQTNTIDINFAVCVFKLGNCELALGILRPLADGTRRNPDPSLTAYANGNLGYCLMKLGEYAAAADAYARAGRYRFRFLIEERTTLYRTLARYCAARAGIISGEDLGDMSVVDLEENAATPVQRPYQLDLNSLYIV